MRAFWAIVRLTLRNALRSHIFQLLLVVLLFCICFIPASIGGGTAQDFIRVSLLYSIWAIGLILALSSLWLGCYVMAQDIDSYQLHMVVAKPVSRIVIWLGKWTGINLLNAILLIFSLIVVYGIVSYRYRIDDRFTQEERKKIADEVLVGRRVFMPRQPDYAAQAREKLRERLKKMEKEGTTVTAEMQEKLYQEIFQQVGAASAEVAPGMMRRWVYDKLPDVSGQPVYLRFRPYVGKVSSEDQRQTRVWWQVMIPAETKKNDAGQLELVSEWGQPLTMQPEQLLSGGFYEKTIPADWKITSIDGTVRLTAANLDPYGAKHYYQPADGPKLLIRICGFEGNYLRAALVMLLQLFLLSALACAFGGFLTMPTAVFMVISYLLCGLFSTLLTDADFYVSGFFDHFGQALASLLLLIVIPLQAFDVTDLLSNGELIEYTLILKLFVRYFICRGVPLVLLGIWLYRRRELALAVRK